MTFEEKMEIVINNYFKKECSVNTSIREAFEKGFRIGVKKGSSAQPTIEPRPKSRKVVKSNGMVGYWACEYCDEPVHEDDNFCPNCGADMREEKDGG